MKAKSKVNLQESGAISPRAEALSRFQDLLSAEEFSRLKQELELPHHPAIRINMLKTVAGCIQEYADRYGWRIKSVPFCDTGWWVKEMQHPISQTVEHLMGFYYIQDAASMLPVQLFRFKDNPVPLVLDMAASPGGKTTHLIDRTLDSGLVVANDSGRDRIIALRLVLQTWGGLNTAVTRFPGENFGVWFPETFDCVLVDAPCSMQSLRSTGSRPMRSISEKEQQSLSKRQGRLLESAFRAAKPGGEVVYSTCTLSPEENEVVLETLLDKFGSAVRIENLTERLPVPAPALSAFKKNGETIRLSPEIQNAARLWPHIYRTSGFFAALITKVSHVETTPISPPVRSANKSGLTAMKDPEVRDLIDKLHQAYGINFQKVLEKQNLSLWRHKGIVYAIPEAWFNLFENVPFQSIGMRIGKESPPGFIPSHEWVSRFGGSFTTGFISLSDDRSGAWLRGEDIRGKPNTTYPKGMTVLVRDHSGRILGRGKVLADRLKNLLPSRLVYWN